MRISDWSSDVCSSDLFVKRDEWLLNMGRSSRGSAALIDAQGAIYVASERFRELLALEFGAGDLSMLPFALTAERRAEPEPFQIGSLHFRVQPQGSQIGRASCRERVCKDG